MVRNKKQSIEKAWDETDDSRYAPQRRKHARATASLQVAYQVGDRYAVAVSQNVSQGGMLLRSAPGLAAGDEVNFTVTLGDGDAPIEVRGEVLAVSPQGVRVCFSPGQIEAMQRVRAYVITEVMPGLETEVLRTNALLRHIVELGNLYADQGRYGDALEMYRAQMRRHPANLVLIENMSTLINTHLALDGDAEQAELEELATLVDTGLALGPSEALRIAQKTVERLTTQRRKNNLSVVPANQPPDYSTFEAQLEARENQAAQRQTELSGWETKLDARDRELGLREASLQIRTSALQSADAELQSRTTSLDRAHAAYDARLGSLEGRESALRQDEEALLTRVTELSGKNKHLTQRMVHLEETERHNAAQRAELLGRERTLTSREEALNEARHTLRQEQAAYAARGEDYVKQLASVQAANQANLQVWLQRVQHFTAAIRVKLAAKNQEFAAVRESLSVASAKLIEREMVLAAEQRNLQTQLKALEAREEALAQAPKVESENARLTKLSTLLHEAENDLATRDHALSVLKQKLTQARAALDQKNAQLADLTKTQLTGTLETEVKDPSPVRDVMVQASGWQTGDFDVIDTEEVTDDGEEITNVSQPNAPTFKWRVP